MEKEKNNISMELIEDEDIEKAILDQLDGDDEENESDLCDLTPDDLVKLKREFEVHDRNITDELNSVSISYLRIAEELYFMSKMNLKLFGYKNVYDYGNAKYHFRTTSIKNMLAIVKKCCIEDSNVGFKLKSEYSEFSYSQLVELLSVDADKLEYFEPSMTVKQIRENKVLIKLEKIYHKNIFGNIKNFKEFVKNVFTNPGLCIPQGDTSEGKKEKFLEDCEKLGTFKFEEVSSGLDKYASNYLYEYRCKLIYSSYKKYPIDITLSFSLKDIVVLVVSKYSYSISDVIWDYGRSSFEGIGNFKEIYSFFLKYLDVLKQIDKAKEEKKKEKEKSASSKEKQKEKEKKFNEIHNKGLMRYGDNKKLLNSYPEIKQLIKDRASKINISDDDEIFVGGYYTYPRFYVKIIDKYYFELSYMSIDEKDKNGNYYSCGSSSAYKTKEYYEMIFDFIRKSQTSDGKEKNEDKKT